MIEKLNTHTAELTVGNKSDATSQRPEGERLLSAPLVALNLNEFMKQLKEETAWTDSDRNSKTIFKSGTMTMILMAMHKDAELKPHNADGPITVQVLDGTIEFTANQRSSQMEKGHLIALQQNITHSVRAVTDTCFLLTRNNPIQPN